ncbi:tRNA (adenosine(37)-N6)-threonylcarbamoyltransferase complex dimerization subunit type 1 TsaB [Fulvivirga sp. M361]|uniref:tRNA (adenosine(37)-N6)-threonylcarbamoyltransferase complex dimerization subunit type 1 TsaB n=1 Tax=Fulvivirga sp. M361 TaxID=2594266 RepID=UPI00351BA593
MSIETATTICSVALHLDGEIRALNSYFLDKSHSSLLQPTIRKMMDDCSFNMADLSAIAVSMGPGSYTGLRIGVSAAKGLCYALDKPLIGINTLSAMAYGVRKNNVRSYWFCPMLDARRMEVYTLLLDDQFNEIKVTHPLIVEEPPFSEYLDKQPVLFFGNGAGKCKEVIKHTNALFLDGIEPSAVYVGDLAYQKFQSRSFEDLAYFEPYYLKEFKATKPKVKV